MYFRIVYFNEYGCFQTFDGVPLDAPWFQASPPSNRFFLVTTGSGTLGMSTTADLATFGSFAEVLNFFLKKNRTSCYHPPISNVYIWWEMALIFNLLLPIADINLSSSKIHLRYLVSVTVFTWDIHSTQPKTPLTTKQTHFSMNCKTWNDLKWKTFSYDFSDIKPSRDFFPRITFILSGNHV